MSVVNVLRAARTVLVVLTAMSAIACTQRPGAEKIPSEMLREDEPTQESWGAIFYVSENGIPRFEVAAPYMAQLQNGDSTYTLLSGPPDSDLPGYVEAGVYDDDGERSATLTAEKLIYYEDDRFEATGNVKVVTRRDKVLETDYLIWYESEARIEAPGFVRIEAPDERIQGYELQSDERLDNYRLARVTGQVIVED